MFYHRELSSGNRTTPLPSVGGLFLPYKLLIKWSLVNQLPIFTLQFFCYLANKSLRWPAAHLDFARNAGVVFATYLGYPLLLSWSASCPHCCIGIWFPDDPDGNRTRVAAVKGQCLRPLDYGAWLLSLGSWHQELCKDSRAIFTSYINV